MGRRLNRITTSQGVAMQVMHHRSENRVVQGAASGPCHTLHHHSPPKGGGEVVVQRGVAERGGAILDLAERLRRLAPSPRHPERFHEEKSEIVHELRQLASEVRHG